MHIYFSIYFVLFHLLEMRKYSNDFWFCRIENTRVIIQRKNWEKGKKFTLLFFTTTQLPLSMFSSFVEIVFSFLSQTAIATATAACVFLLLAKSGNNTTAVRIERKVKDKKYIVHREHWNRKSYHSLFRVVEQFWFFFLYSVKEQRKSYSS